MSNTTSNRILSSEPEDSMGCDLTREHDYRKEIEEQIEYGYQLKTHPYEKELLDGIVDIMLEIRLNQNNTMLIASATYPSELVKNRYEKLNSEHISYVIDCFNANTTRVGNIKKYLMTVLFNAPATIGGFYTAAVHHDMPYLVSEKI